MSVLEAFFDLEQVLLFASPMLCCFGGGFWLAKFSQRKLAESTEAMYASALAYKEHGDKRLLECRQLHGQMEELLARWRKLTAAPPADPSQTMRGPAGLH